MRPHLGFSLADMTMVELFAPDLPAGQAGGRGCVRGEPDGRRMGRMWAVTRMWPDVWPDVLAGCGHPLSPETRMWTPTFPPTFPGCPDIRRTWRMWRRIWTPTSPPLLHPFSQERSGGPGTPTFHPPTFHPLFTFTHDPRQAADDERRTWKGFGRDLEGIWTPTFERKGFGHPHLSPHI